MTREEVETHTRAVTTIIGEAISQGTEPSTADKACLVTSGMALLGGLLTNIARLADCADENLQIKHLDRR